jgi:heme/copper-type cytochrome/quinol oxidase subunit 2
LIVAFPLDATTELLAQREADFKIRHQNNNPISNTQQIAQSDQKNLSILTTFLICSIFGLVTGFLNGIFFHCNKIYPIRKNCIYQNFCIS